MKHLQMQRRPGTLPARWHKAQERRQARGLPVIAPGRAAAQLINNWKQARRAA